ncbi:hypothetical protein D3C86_1714280 [compost metagenome]
MGSGIEDIQVTRSVTTWNKPHVARTDCDMVIDSLINNGEYLLEFLLGALQPGAIRRFDTDLELSVIELWHHILSNKNKAQSSKDNNSKKINSDNSFLHRHPPLDDRHKSHLYPFKEIVFLWLFLFVFQVLFNLFCFSFIQRLSRMGMDLAMVIVLVTFFLDHPVG